MDKFIEASEKVTEVNLKFVWKKLNSFAKLNPEAESYVHSDAFWTYVQEHTKKTEKGRVTSEA